MRFKYPNNTKLRIALLLDSKTNKQVKKINNQIGGEIKFNKRCLPHITLVSGVLINNENFNTVCAIINKVLQTYLANKLEIEFSAFYKSEDKQWMFLKIEENETLNNLIIALKTGLNGYFEISPARQMHVTIAKGKTVENLQENNFSFEVKKPFVLSKLCIGLRGENGTLINTIKKFKTRHKSLTK